MRFRKKVVILVIDRLFQNISKSQEILVFGTEYKVTITTRLSTLLNCSSMDSCSFIIWRALQTPFLLSIGAILLLNFLFLFPSFEKLNRIVLCLWIDTVFEELHRGLFRREAIAFGDQLRDETFKERVGFMSVRQLSRIAKERGAGSLCYAEAMLVAYNRKCKYTLRMSKLHSGKVAAEDDFVEENEEPLTDDPVLVG